MQDFIMNFFVDNVIILIIYYQNNDKEGLCH
jgi:hypothetical protein